MAKCRLPLLIVLLLLLSGCAGPALQLSVRFDRVDGLKAGDPVVFRDQNVGEVEAVEYTRAGVFLAQIHIDAEYRAAATTESHFYLAADPANPERKRIEIEHAGGGQLLADGAVVNGESRGLLGGVLPLGEIFRGMGEGMRQFSEQMEQLRRGLEKLPNSEDAKKLEEEWRRFMEQLDKAGRDAEKRLEPGLRQEMEEMNRRFRELEPKTPAAPPQPAPPPKSQRQNGYSL